MNVTVKILREQILGLIKAHIARSGLSVVTHDEHILNKLPVAIELEATQRKIPELDLLRQIEQGEVDVPLPSSPGVKPGKPFSFPPHHPFERASEPPAEQGSSDMRGDFSQQSLDDA